MEPPRDAQVFDWARSIFWFGSDNIVYSVAKKNASETSPPSLEEVKINVAKFMEIVGNRKVCVLAEVTFAIEPNREIRDFVAEEFPKCIKAVAMISKSALGSLFANLFLSIKNRPYPTKIFTNEEEAKKWLKKYL